jgi:hypothetical protein
MISFFLPNTVALHLRKSEKIFMGPKAKFEVTHPPFSLCHESNWIFSCRLPNFEKINQAGLFFMSTSLIKRAKTAISSSCSNDK